MFMFLPFLIAFGTVLCIVWGKKKLSYTFWSILLVVVILTFEHHATDVLNLSF
nr:DUF5993 family protein [Serratia symbiotica]